jgi:hypothetical protein
MDEKLCKAYLKILAYYRQQDEILETQAKESLEKLQKEFDKQEKEQRKLEMMREHPEWFETTSPKEYGMKLLKRKRK